MRGQTDRERITHIGRDVYQSRPFVMTESVSRPEITRQEAPSLSKQEC